MACGPGSPELSKSNSYMATELLAFAFTIVFPGFIGLCTRGAGRHVAMHRLHGALFQYTQSLGGWCGVREIARIRTVRFRCIGWCDAALAQPFERVLEGYVAHSCCAAVAPPATASWLNLWECV